MLSDVVIEWTRREFMPPTPLVIIYNVEEVRHDVGMMKNV
jgi:hypothetical protein